MNIFSLISAFPILFHGTLPKLQASIRITPQKEFRLQKNTNYEE